MEWKPSHTIQAEVDGLRGCAGQCMRRYEVWREQFETVEEPPLEGCIGAIVRSSLFQTGCFAVILLDTAFTAFTINYTMKNRTGPNAQLQAIQVCFVVPYTCELAMKIIAHKRYFFIGADWKWNWFDLVLVFQAAIDAIMDLLLTEDGEGEDVTFVRILRLMKLGKIFRLFRALRFLRELRVMLVSIASSLPALFWAFVTLALILYTFALMFVQGMSTYIGTNGDTISDAEFKKIMEYFGSVQEACLTLYKASSGGTDWENVHDLVRLSGEFYTVAFIFFVGFFNFAVLNILTGIFMEKALVAAQPDREAQALEQRKAEVEQATALKQLLMDMDEDDSGTLTLDEFVEKSQNEYVKAYFSTLGLEISDAAMFFDFLSSTSGKSDLPIDEFVKRCARMKGQASSIDLQGLAYEVSIIHQRVDALCGATGVKSVKLGR